MRKAILIVSIAAFVFVAWPHASDADPPWGKREKRYKYKDRDDDRDEYKHKKKRRSRYRKRDKRRFRVGPFGKMMARRPRGPVWVKGGPPPWAPAHGYRRKMKRRAVYATPYGIDLGRCYRQELGAILGGVAGGVIGSTIGKGSGRTVATVGGALIGLLVGSSVGRDLDQLDQACTGQVLEHARTHHTVAWRNPDRGTSYEVTPTRIYQNGAGEYCREYTSVSTMAGRMQKVYGKACRRPDGTWRLIN